MRYEPGETDGHVLQGGLITADAAGMPRSIALMTTGAIRYTKGGIADAGGMNPAAVSYPTWRRHRRTEYDTGNGNLQPCDRTPCSGERAAGTILHNGLYAELFGGLLMWAGNGVESAFGDGALAAVPRGDLAEVAAVVASNPAPHSGRVYDLVGTPITAGQVADELGVAHHAISLGEDRRRLLEETPGLLPFQPPMLASIAMGIRHGFLDGTAPDLTDLLGRAARDPLATAVAAASATRPEAGV
ncbi:Rossmann-fold NAD(P)-binding domain-containing protein [Streptomyces hirsutus]|uniref:hypothetical protein n=1 Tax=Streptomyces hirsutus TaxID=35620 RepID=UPI003688B3BF